MKQYTQKEIITEIKTLKERVKVLESKVQKNKKAIKKIIKPKEYSYFKNGRSARILEIFLTKNETRTQSLNKVFVEGFINSFQSIETKDQLVFGCASEKNTKKMNNFRLEAIKGSLQKSRTREKDYFKNICKKQKYPHSQKKFVETEFRKLLYRVDKSIIELQKKQIEIVNNGLKILKETEEIYIESFIKEDEYYKRNPSAKNKNKYKEKKEKKIKELNNMRTITTIKIIKTLEKHEDAHFKNIDRKFAWFKNKINIKNNLAKKPDTKDVKKFDMSTKEALDFFKDMQTKTTKKLEFLNQHQNKEETTIKNSQEKSSENDILEEMNPGPVGILNFNGDSNVSKYEEVQEIREVAPSNNNIEVTSYSSKKNNPFNNPEEHFEFDNTKEEDPFMTKLSKESERTIPKKSIKNPLRLIAEIFKKPKGRTKTLIQEQKQKMPFVKSIFEKLRKRKVTTNDGINIYNYVKEGKNLQELYLDFNRNFYINNRDIEFISKNFPNLAGIDIDLTKRVRDIMPLVFLRNLQVLRSAGSNIKKEALKYFLKLRKNSGLQHVATFKYINNEENFVINEGGNSEEKNFQKFLESNNLL